MKRKFVLGDIHARYDELIELFKLAGFNYDEDELIQLGDLVDRGPEPLLCIHEILKVKNLIAIRGNHDWALMDYIDHNCQWHTWNGSHGSASTMIKAKNMVRKERIIIQDFLHSQISHYIDKDNRIFTHGGFDRQELIGSQVTDNFMWDRELIGEVMSMQRNKSITVVPTLEGFTEIYVGHTPTLCYTKDENGIYKSTNSWEDIELNPINILNFWDMDTGAGFTQGKISMMNIETKEIFQIKINNPSTLW